MKRALLVGLLVVNGCGIDAPPAPREAVAHTSEQALRPTDTSSGLMWRFQPGDVVESIGNDAGYRVHFTRAGLNAVPARDADDSGVPDFVEEVASTYASVGGLYHGALGYRRPTSDALIGDNGGDERFDIYLVDFNLSADGTFRVDQCPPSSLTRCIGYVVQENDYAGYGYPSTSVANRILASHEYFHAVQAAYDDDQNVVISEGTAVWATERFDPSTNDFEGFVHGYLERTDRSIDSAPPGPVPTFAYGSALFFRFLTERHDDALIRKLWEHLENGQGDPLESADVANPTFVIQLDALLKREYGSSFAEEWAEFARWNLYTSTAADPTKAWLEGAKYPPVTMGAITLPHLIDGLRVFYGSAQYFTAPAGGRTLVTAAIADSMLSTQNDLDGMVLWLAARKNGKNTEVVRITNGETVDITGGAVIAVVANTHRGAIGASLSQRPGLCVGTPEEVRLCLGVFGVDAGIDGGMPVDAGMDAGTDVDAGMTEPMPRSGCGCGMEVSPLWFLAALAGRRRARRSSK